MAAPIPSRYLNSIRLRVAYEVPISGTSPGAILYEPQQNHIFTANRESANLSVLDAGTLQVVATVPLPGAPESMATDDAGHVYVNINTAPGRLVMIDAKSLMVKAKWLLKECAGPTAIAFDVTNHRLVLGMRKPGHGGNRLGVGQGDRPGRDRPGIRRRGLRSRTGPGIQFQRHRRHADRDSPRFAR